MSDKPKLLWHSNCPWGGTGYAQQTALFTERLKDHYDVGISAFWGLEGGVVPWQGIPVLPGVGQTYGNETIIEHARAFLGSDIRSGLVVSLMDAWVLDAHVWTQVNHAAWVPVDHEPAPEPVYEFFQRSGSIPLAMSKFGMRQLEGLDPIYLPHGIDTKVYRPIDQAEAREQVGMEDGHFVVGMVAANKGNPSRKCFVEAFRAFKVFHEKHPEARLYLHTEATGRFQGVDLIAALYACGVPREAVVWCDQYRAVHMPFPHETMAHVYSSLDVLLAPSAGEGFGIPAIEAQACGVPVIVSDFSAQPELCGAGWLVEGSTHYTPIGSWQFRPDPEDILAALESAYRERGNPELATKARKQAEDYDADLVFERYMLPALAEAQERFDERKPIELKAAA